MTPIAGLPGAQAQGPANLEESQAAASDGVEGITPAQFRALLSPADLDDIEEGDIHPETLRAYAGSFAEGIAQGGADCRGAVCMMTPKQAYNMRHGAIFSSPDRTARRTLLTRQGPSRPGCSPDWEIDPV